MSVTLVIAIIAAVCLVSAILIRRSIDRREIERHSITPDELQNLLAAKSTVPVFDVRLPLDLLVDSETIPGAVRLTPKDVIDNPALIPRDTDTVVYCTCPSDKTSRAILQKAIAAHHFRIKFLRGGLAAWKAKGYPVEPYQKPFHLDTGT